MPQASPTNETASALQQEPAVAGIQVITTGWGEQHREHRFGSWMPRWLWALTSQSWVKLPVHCFLIQHRDGPVLFDAGADPAIENDPNYISQAIGRVLLHRIFRFHIKESDALRHQLNSIGEPPAAIRKAVISHLHFDHVGGIGDLTNADLLVSEREWAQLSEPHPEREWILREHIELPGANWCPVAFQPTEDPLLERFGGAYDVMGDGSLMLIPTPGHTPGSLSMLVRSQGMRPVLLVGDLTYQADLLMADQVPGTGDPAVLRESYAKVRALKQDLPELIIVASHDPAASDMLSRIWQQP